ncbi:hypothetical protein [Eubacterium limosum]|uniref:hypothetical protein n=1 Tax=Eubacterium limosum TaxID=1736 RepID=UPI0037247FDB
MTPKSVKDAMQQIIDVLDEDDSLTMTPEQAARALGTTPEAIINSNGEGRCPFAFMHRKGAGMRRNTVINKAVFWNWVCQGQAWH